MGDITKPSNRNIPSVLTEEKSILPRKNNTDDIKDRVKKNLRQFSGSPFLLENGSIQINCANNVHLGNSVLLTTSSASRSTAVPEDDKPEITPAVTALLESDSVISNFHRLAVDCQVGSNWRYLGQALGGISTAQMDQLEEPFKAEQYPFREVIYQLILLWEHQSQVKPTVGMLAKALWECKMYSAFMSLLEIEKVSKTKQL